MPRFRKGEFDEPETLERTPLAVETIKQSSQRLAKPIFERPINHFIRLAQGGCGKPSTTPESNANALACSVLDHVSTLDKKAVDGLCEFIGVAHDRLAQAAEMLEGK